MKHILVINFTDLTNDSRVKRHISFLKEKYKVSVLCVAANFKADYPVIVLKQKPLTLIRKVFIGFFLLIRFHSLAHRLMYPYSYIVSNLQSEKIDLILANDVESLPLAFKIANKNSCNVVFDAHEYAPRHFEDKWVWRTFFQPMNIYLCRKYIAKTAAMLTVGKGLANEYEKHFKCKPVVITNANYFYELNPSPVGATKIRIVHHGIATPSRKLELMIEMMDHLDDRFSLDLYLISTGFSSSKTIDYPQKLETLAARGNRTRIIPPVKTEEVVPKLNEYDIGLFLIPPVNFNYANTLPNKLFDFIQARLAIAVGPTPEMAEIVNEYNLGVVSDDFTPQSLAKKIISLTLEQVESYKRNTEKAARELNAETNKTKFQNLVEQALSK